MSKPPEGRLERIEDIRAHWPNEAQDFTPWLAKRIDLLGEALGIELEVETEEMEVGPFRADILCKDGGDNWVVIENQIDRTDHKHLGQLITYAAGLDALTIIWIADSFMDEHRAAIDWLNQLTDESVNFFGVQIEVWKIGDSEAAPRFNTVAKPNDWSKSVYKRRGRGEGDTQKNPTNREFWLGFSDYLKAQKSSIRPGRVGSGTVIRHPMKRKGFHLEGILTQKEIRAELEIRGNDAKKFYALLQEQKGEIEAELDEGLTWFNPTNHKKCRIYLSRPTNIYQGTDWTKDYEWLFESMVKMERVFKPRIHDLDLANFDELYESEDEDGSG